MYFTLLMHISKTKSVTYLYDTHKPDQNFRRILKHAYH